MNVHSHEFHLLEYERKGIQFKFRTNKLIRHRLHIIHFDFVPLDASSFVYSTEYINALLIFPTNIKDDLVSLRIFIYKNANSNMEALYKTNVSFRKNKIF